MTLCAVIPTYNNVGTVADVVRRTLAVCPDVIVVDDGSTDGTSEQLRAFGGQVRLVAYGPNRGKGYALRQGFKAAREAGFDYAATLDADGQHSPEDLPRMLTALAALGDGRALVVGSRSLAAEGMPAANSFANRFSNFWFRLQTGIRLPDTQTGFRLYPLRHLPPLWLLSNRYESELSLLVFSAWRGLPLVPVPVGVSYPADRVSHFRPFLDFFRISILNSILCLLALVYGRPRMWMAKHLHRAS